jgi:Rrf2 family protein
MKLSTRTQYGTLLMINLALEYGKGPVLLKDIAKKEAISEKYLSQIIIPLKANGLVKSFRGPHGGYILGKPMKEIAVKDIIETLEGTADLIGYEKNAPHIQRPTLAVARNLWIGLGEKITQLLAAVTLAELVKQCLENETSSVMYNI